MKYKHTAFAAFYFILVIGLMVVVEGAPPHNTVLRTCLAQRCDMDSGPVCAVDASGLPRTFVNKCMADLEFCRYGTYFAEVKFGEC